MEEFIEWLKGSKYCIDENDPTATADFEYNHRWEISRNVMINKALSKIEELGLGDNMEEEKSLEVEALRNELNRVIVEHREDVKKINDRCQEKIDYFEDVAHFHKDRYDNLVSGEKRHRLEVKLMNRDEILVIEGSDNINMPDVIESQFMNKEEFIIFGYLGVRRSEIERYVITEA